LLSGLLQANDKNNFLAFLLEATFAYQFEASGLQLQYEVKQSPDNASSIDFLLETASKTRVYFELRLLQQDAETAEAIAEQLEISGAYAISKDGAAEQRDILRLQSTILGKIQKKDGIPIKFLKSNADTINLVVICVSDIILEMADPEDCRLAMYGDRAVRPEARRDVVGMFQDIDLAQRPDWQPLSDKFKHAQKTLHGVLFLFRDELSEFPNWSLRSYLVWNWKLLNEEEANAVAQKVLSAVPLEKS